MLHKRNRTPLDQARAKLQDARRRTDDVRDAVEQAKGDTAKGLQVDLPGWEAALLNCENLEAQAEAEVIRLETEQVMRTEAKRVAEVVDIFTNQLPQPTPAERVRQALDFAERCATEVRRQPHCRHVVELAIEVRRLYAENYEHDPDNEAKLERLRAASTNPHDLT